MSCLICAGQAESVECTGGWEEGQIFDTERMRAWLVSRRELMPIPTIDHGQAILAL